VDCCHHSDAPTLIEIVDTSVVNVSLDHIRGSLSAGIDESTWTITSYLVSNAIIIPITGWLSRLSEENVSDLFYLPFYIQFLYVRLFMESPEPCIFRVLQGLGAALFSPFHRLFFLKHFQLVNTDGDGHLRRRHHVRTIIGPLLEDGLQTTGLAWIFYINVPIGMISILMTYFLSATLLYAANKMKIDYWGLYC